MFRCLGAEVRESAGAQMSAVPFRCFLGNCKQLDSTKPRAPLQLIQVPSTEIPGSVWPPKKLSLIISFLLRLFVVVPCPCSCSIVQWRSGQSKQIHVPLVLGRVSNQTDAILSGHFWSFRPFPIPHGGLFWRPYRQGAETSANI